MSGLCAVFRVQTIPTQIWLRRIINTMIKIGTAGADPAGPGSYWWIFRLAWCISLNHQACCCSDVDLCSE